MRSPIDHGGKVFMNHICMHKTNMSLKLEEKK